MANKIYKKSRLGESTPNRQESFDRGYINSNIAKELNTYKNWQDFNLYLEPSEYDPDTGKAYDINGAKGVKSIFNNIHAIPLSDKYAMSYNRPLLDTPGTRKAQREQTACTIKDLVECGEKMGRQIYNYSDFAYCKYLGKVTNNYLITLRRFPTPCGDHIDLDLINNMASDTDQILQGHVPDIGRMVTWMGTPGNEMSNILKYTYKMNWKDLEAKIQEESTSENTSPLAQIFNVADSQYSKQVQQGIAGANLSKLPSISIGKKFNTQLGDPTYGISDWQKNYDDNKTYGPLDVLMKSKIRQQGLEMDQKFTLTFDYQLRSYDGINGRAAFLDLLSNILCVTYTTGKFWGGGYHFYGVHTSNVFTNLPIFKAADRGELNNFAAIGDAITSSWSKATEGFRNGNFMEMVKKIASNVLGMLMGGALNKLGRPQKMALNSLISPAPTGCWHLTIGNPKAPIMEIGNLCMTDATIEHYGPLGLDDFPTGLKVTVNLEPGKSRDISGIEQMYQRGDSRIYSPMGPKIMDMYNAAPEIQMNTTIRETGDIEEINKARTGVTGASNIENSTTHTAEDFVLIKYFGMKEKGQIIMAAREGMFGSKSAKEGNNDNTNKNTKNNKTGKKGKKGKTSTNKKSKK